MSGRTTPHLTATTGTKAGRRNQLVLNELEKLTDILRRRLVLSASGEPYSGRIHKAFAQEEKVTSFRHCTVLGRAMELFQCGIRVACFQLEPLPTCELLSAHVLFSNN